MTGPGSMEELLPQIAWHGRDRLRQLSYPARLRHLSVTAFRAFACDLDLESGQEGGGESDIIFFKSIHRSDYDELFQNVLNACGAQAMAVVTDANRIWGNVPGEYKVLSPWDMLKRAFRQFGNLCRHSGLFWRAVRNQGGWTGVWLTLQFMKLEPAMTRLTQQNPKAIVVFAEMQCMDRFLSWVCLKKGIPCITMQHGLYTEYLETRTVNIHNYQPKFVTDFFAWGSVTAELVSKYSSSVRTHICGKPTRVPPLSVEGSPVEFDCVIIFDQQIFQPQNQEMIDMTRQALPDGRIGVRLHPQNHTSEYDLEGIQITTAEDWMNAKAFVGHTTTLLLDLMEANAVVFRYQTGAESVFTPDPSLEFTSEAELRQKMENPGAGSDGERFRSYVCCRGEEAVNAHVSMIHGIADGSILPYPSEESAN